MRKLLLIFLLCFSDVILAFDRDNAIDIIKEYEKRIRENYPEYTTDFSCRAYSKMELDVENVKVDKLPGFLRNQLEFLGDYSDTSALTGRQYIPALFSETLLERRHTVSPYRDEESVIANRISGVNPENNLLSQFTGSMRMEVNFLNPFVSVFGASFPSPAGIHGREYYDYYLGGETEAGGRKVISLYFFPKPVVSIPVFQGTMQIDLEDYALCSISARMTSGCNVNWIRDLILESTFRRLPDGFWFRDREKAHVSFSFDQWNLTEMAGIVGRRELYWEEPSFLEQPKLKTGLVKVGRSDDSTDEKWWSLNRPVPLSSEEEEVFEMVGQLQEKKIYKKAYGSVYSSVNGFTTIGKIGIGPMLQLVSFNELEGWRPRIGFRSNKYLSTTDRFGGFIAYGFRDKQFKGGVSYEHMFRRDLTRKLSVDAYYDVVQLGRGTAPIVYGNILSSIWHKEYKLAPESVYSVKYEHEFSPNFNACADITLKRIFSTEYVPMYLSNGDSLSSVAANEVHIGLRFSKNETVNRGYFDKNYLFSRYPVLTVDLTGSVPGIRKGDFGYFKPELTLDWRVHMPPVGVSDITLKAGTIIGQVPWQFLYLYKGNPTFFTDMNSFSCMEYFEFAADSWASLMWYHDFRGALLGLIPGVNKLGLRETFLFRMAMGSLRACNDGTSDINSAPVLFPEGMKAIGPVPYMEIGAGITNIFRVARIDFIWRLTHREHELPDGSMERAGRLFTVNIGFDFKF